MHGPSLAATLAAAVWLGLAPADGPPASPEPSNSTPAAAISRARALIAKDDPRAAVTLLQGALPNAGADLGPMIVVLRQAYSRAADQAAKAGRAAEAEDLREDLQILNRKLRGRPDEPRPAPASAPKATLRPEPAVAEPPPPAKADDPPPPRPDVGFEDAPPPRPAESSPPPPPKPSPILEPTPAPAPAPIGAALSDPLSIAAPSPEPDRVPEPTRDNAGTTDGPTSPRPGRERPVDAPRPEPLPPARPDLPTLRDPDGGPSAPPAARRVAAEPGRGDAAVSRASTSTAAIPAVAPAGPTAAEVLKAADTAYLKGLYLDANARYAALAKRGQLPEARKIHWAYCRSVDVVRRLKAKPTSADDWAAIDREIAEIKALSPKYWYAEYLRNRAADMARGSAKGPAPKGRIVRGAMPESETDRPAGGGAGASDLRDLARPAKRPGKPGAFAMAVPSTETPPVVTSHGESGRWQVKETASFVILHDDPALAEAVARAAESAREATTRRWTGSPPPRAWEPKCAIYLYPTAAIFAQMTGEPPESPGLSTMESNGAAITLRRINVRADAANLIAAVVPHEVTHVMLADLFTAKQIPRWADEGISVLSEPASEQEKRVADLDAALDGGKIFTVENLMASADYPEGKFWPLYYAQGVSLTRFLVEQGKPGQFIEFLQGSQRRGIEPELKRVYGIEGYADLQSRWLDYARQSSAARVASRSGEMKVR